MKVDQLKAELKQRGHSTRGKKPELRARLEAALGIKGMVTETSKKKKDYKKKDPQRYILPDMPKIPTTVVTQQLVLKKKKQNKGEERRKKGEAHTDSVLGPQAAWPQAARPQVTRKGQQPILAAARGLGSSSSGEPELPKTLRVTAMVHWSAEEGAAGVGPEGEER
jgi:hypothetical protein